MNMTGKSVLFVCCANICRSPMAEACFKQLLFENEVLRHWFVDSAATTRLRIGFPPDSRSEACLKNHGIYHHIRGHIARQVRPGDFDHFDYILGMDEENLRELHIMEPRRKYKARLMLLGSFDSDVISGRSIPDPFASTDLCEFEIVYQRCRRSCYNFWQHINGQLHQHIQSNTLSQHK